MKYTKQFIFDAIDGECLFRARYRSSSQHIVYENADEMTSIKTVHEVLLDPLAWSAVGKTRGWGYRKVHDEKIEYGALNMQHRFIDALAGGKTIEESLQSISK